jgi:hypothetical protein
VPAILDQPERAGGEPARQPPAALGLNRGISARPALRFATAAARFAHPLAYASLEFSPHQGATRSLAAFHAFRSP